jgi:uncharacterized repeat protein (TIGR03847 family)
VSESWEFDQPGRFTAGAIGDPGRRVFFFQVFADGTEVAVKCEKQQAVALAEHLVNLLADLPGDEPADVPPAESLPPAALSWVVGSISIGVDRADSRLVVVLEEALLDDEDDAAALTEDPARLRVRLTREQVRAYASQVAALNAGGRPLCRLCDQPIDPDGHACPRLN